MLARQIAGNRPNSASAYKSNPQPQQRGKRQPKSVSDPRLAFSASPALASLPKFSPNIPHTLVLESADQRLATTALALIDLGIVSEEDSQAANVSGVIESGLTRWMEKFTSGMSHLFPDLSITDSYSNLDFSDGDIENGIDNKCIPEEGHEVIFGIEFPKWRWGWMKNKFERLEGIQKGLAETALSALNSSLYRTGKPLTPNFALDCARYFYWQGEDDETELKAEYEENGEEWDEDEQVTKAGFDKEIPTFVSEPRQVLNKDDLMALVGHADPQVAITAQATLELLEIDDIWENPVFADSLLSDGGGVLYPSTYMQWDEDGELMPRIIDDHLNYLYEISGTSYSVLFGCNNDPESLAKTMSQIELYMKRLAVSDRLMGQLADFQAGTREP